MASLSCSLCGCQIIIGVLMILRGLPKDDADFKKQTRHNLEDKSKKVVILCTSPEKAKQDHRSLDGDMIAEVTRQMKAHGINVIDPHNILNWIDDNGGELREADLAEIGREFEVDYLVQIELNEFSIKDPGSTSLYQGRANAKIRVFAHEETPAEKTASGKTKPGDSTASSKKKSSSPSPGDSGKKSKTTSPTEEEDEDDDSATAKGSGSRAGRKRTPLKQIYFKPYTATYPAHQPVPADQESPAIFRKRFLERVGTEIALLFYAHRLEEEL